MAKKEIFDSEKFFFIIQRVGMRFIGLWPSDEAAYTSWLIFFAIFNAMEILLNGIFQVNFCFKNMDALVKFLNGSTPLITQILTAVKILILVWRRNDLKKMLDYLRDAFVTGKN